MIKIPKAGLHSRFYFFLRGKGIILSGESREGILFSSMQCLILSGEQDVYIRATEDTTAVLFSFSSLVITLELAKKISPVHRKKEVMIPIHAVLERFLTYTQALTGQRVADKEWIEIKKRELFLLLSFLYPAEELSALFYPVLRRQLLFHDMIDKCIQEADSVADLLKASGMKRTTFERKFKMEFGISPYKWILENRAYRVRASLVNSSLPIDEVRRMHRFNSASHFTRFCKQQFGMSPLRIRKQTTTI